jgi:3-deoxy-D-manno-octulosonate 8-phosphate phosphatase (KDO 8-P phosphatase)
VVGADAIGSPPSPALVDKAKHIRVLVTDVDGVWTDGRLFYFPGPQGDLIETKGSAALDGQALRWWHAAGHVSGVISGRDAPGITHRCQMLGVSHIYQGHLDKIEPWEEICAATGAAEDEICYMGDDLPDTPLLRRAGLGVAVENARLEVKSVADYVTATPGGQGALREVIELIMKARGEWVAVLAKYGLE